jgi:hypothetical protein
MMDMTAEELSISEQAELLSLNRTGLYYRLRISAQNEHLLRRI